MDSLITAAAQALAQGDPLGALNRVALRDDAPALALRGIAMAQLGDFARAKILIRKAARAFGPKEALAQARCVIAEAEIALAARDLVWPEEALDAAQATLAQHGDQPNATHAHYLRIRHDLLIGRLDEANQKLSAIDSAKLPATSRTIHELIVAGIAIRHLQTLPARLALKHAELYAREAGIPALSAEVATAWLALNRPAARLIRRGEEKLLVLEDIEKLFASEIFVVDACRSVVRHKNDVISLATRPVLFSLVRVLAEAWPDDVSRDKLIAQAFRLKLADESHRARLRVEIGRLRAVLRTQADVRATMKGFVIAPHSADVAVLAQPVDEKHAALLALLTDGEAWSSSALALALGASTRTVQRALENLAASGKVQALGHGRTRRWITPPTPGFATTLLLPARLPVG